MSFAADPDPVDLAAGLEEARRSTGRLLAGLTEEDARRQLHEAFSPLAWHAGHVAWQEEVWVLRRAFGRPPIDPRLDGIFDTFSSPKGSRHRRVPALPEIHAYRDRVREHTLAALERLDEAKEPSLLEGGWCFRFVTNHERQHAETMAVIRLLDGLAIDGLPPPRSAPPAEGGMLAIPGGRVVLGADDDPDGWDNERRAHEVEVPAFRIGRTPVTNGEWLAFMEAGGYADDRLWSPEGIGWRRGIRAAAPLHWSRGPGGWTRRTLAGPRPVEPGHPVAHVSWFEAQAFARWAGARLPREDEWERAASWDDAAGAKRRWPWGDDPGGAAEAALGLEACDTAPCGGPAAPCGGLDFAGNVWEWTADPFRPYPGFTPGPYRGYSEPWFGDAHRVLRGGCHLTHPAIARAAFRNWFEPETRAFPTGLRLAADPA
ncbi:MAG TPA: ergothioneine biosynthesis protein EgtB [Vulgatibacter sp.]|nr:ergothioneine biosynthesis protein EgtB [Vulgatibacter sp.]